MKKYIQSMMAFAAIVSFASCSSEDNNTTIENESAVKVMTFTATQEGDEQSTRAAISSTDSKVINWEEGDQISIFDGTNNNRFTLTDGVESTSGKFSGEAEQSTSYTAVYPYQANASLSGNDVTNVTLPATQNATDNSFDKNSALMMAKSDNKTLEFKNAVGYVKVTPKFACSKIVLQAAGVSEYLAGKCTLSYGDGMPSIAFTSEQSTSITLSGNITANTAYYIAVPAVTLSTGWSISFTDNTGNVYTRTGSNSITFKRNIVINLGEFSRTDNNLKLTLKENGKVPADKQVDMGVFTIGEKKYRLIFTKSNLTATGLAANEYDYGDYFAWGATEPWYSEINNTSTNCSDWTAVWKSDKTDGYYDNNCPSYNNDAVYVENGILKMEYDPARTILGGEWQLPTKEIWAELIAVSKKSWDDSIKGYKFENNDKTLFLPASGDVVGSKFRNVRNYGIYWSGTADSSTVIKANRLGFFSGDVFVTANDPRFYGHSVRPVRLVAVD